jgi:hypothetical protein
MDHKTALKEAQRLQYESLEKGLDLYIDLSTNSESGYTAITVIGKGDKTLLPCAFLRDNVHNSEKDNISTVRHLEKIISDKESAKKLEYESTTV